MQVNKISKSDVGHWYIAEDGTVLQVLHVYGPIIHVNSPQGRFYYPIHDIARRIKEEDAVRIISENNFQKIGMLKTRKLSKLAKRVVAVSSNGEQQIFDSLTIAATKLGLSQSTISEACKGKRKTAGGYSWRYES